MAATCEGGDTAGGRMQITGLPFAPVANFTGSFTPINGLPLARQYYHCLYLVTDGSMYIYAGNETSHRLASFDDLGKVLYFQGNIVYHTNA